MTKQVSAEADGRVEAIADEYANLLHRPNISYDGLREGIARAIYAARATLPSAGDGKWKDLAVRARTELELLEMNWSLIVKYYGEQEDLNYRAKSRNAVAQEIYDLQKIEPSPPQPAVEGLTFPSPRTSRDCKIEELNRPSLLAARDWRDDAIELAWGLIANANGGDWEKASQEWQDAAARWRDTHYAKLANRPQTAAEGWTADKELERDNEFYRRGLTNGRQESVARIEELERELRESKAAELEKMDGLCDLWHSNFIEVSEKLIKAEAREADLTAARELDLGAMRTALDYLVMPVDTEARIAKEKIQERLAVRIKPASALTATSK